MSFGKTAETKKGPGGNPGMTGKIKEKAGMIKFTKIGIHGTIIIQDSDFAHIWVNVLTTKGAGNPGKKVNLHGQKPGDKKGIFENKIGPKETQNEDDFSPVTLDNFHSLFKTKKTRMSRRHLFEKMLKWGSAPKNGNGGRIEPFITYWVCGEKQQKDQYLN